MTSNELRAQVRYLTEECEARRGDKKELFDKLYQRSQEAIRLRDRIALLERVANLSDLLTDAIDELGGILINETRHSDDSRRMEAIRRLSGRVKEALAAAAEREGTK